jgi:hypothetical protein
VANEIEAIRPDLIGLHAHKQVKERTSLRPRLTQITLV